MANRVERIRFEEQLREGIACALHQVKSYELPAECVRLGLAAGTAEEAFSSKRSYVKARLKTLSETDLMDLAQRVLSDFDDAALFDLISEHTLPAALRISELTRRNVLRMLDPLDDLFGPAGREDLRACLEVLAPSWDSPCGPLSRRLTDEVDRHYVQNADWAHSELLEKCGALRCAQHRFFRLIERVLRPEARTGQDQGTLASQVDGALGPDGYAVRPAEYVSGHPVYAIVRRCAGVEGSAKNLIFASIGAKPEIVLQDAINNDIRITRNAELCLAYDRPISSAKGLSWTSLADWWRERESLPDVVVARRRLGERLKKSLPDNSPGEHVLFRTYFECFSQQLGDGLPALLPQVYLYFDPLTIRQRGEEGMLPRQRMDFLLLLPQGVRVVLEVDGKHHYSNGEKAAPDRYAEMIAEDRQLRLRGYELYRFGAAEFSDTQWNLPDRVIGPKSRTLAKEFFERLFARHRVGQDG